MMGPMLQALLTDIQSKLEDQKLRRQVGCKGLHHTKPISNVCNVLVITMIINVLRKHKMKVKFPVLLGNYDIPATDRPTD